jgi:dihydropteroate synthase
MSQSEQLGAFAPAAWVHARGVLSLERPRVVGIVNVTPDSFYDGGRFSDGGGLDVDAVVRQCETMVRHGVDVLDVGGESTRPGADPVPPSLELDRVATVIERIGSLGVPISVDTRRAEVAREAMARGASMINDVSGLDDPNMAAVAVETDAGLVVGHLRGTPADMHKHVRFVDLLAEVTDEISTAVDAAVAGGVERPRIVVDPGIGFGKSAEQSAALVAASGWLRQATRCPVMIGASRKSFIGVLSGARDVGARLPGSLAAALVAVERGASLIRVHDVAETVQALGTAASIRAAFERHADAIERGEEGLQ